MIVLIDKSFEKDIHRIKDKKLLNSVADIIEMFETVSNLEAVKGLKKLSGFKKEFRIKLSDYRIGITVENHKVIFVRFLHRKDIYKYFPK